MTIPWLVAILAACGGVGLGILLGMSWQWRRNKAYTDKVVLEKAQLQSELNALGKWTQPESRYEKALRKFDEMQERVEKSLAERRDKTL